jgi:DNA-binding NtrC family response regulator
MPGMTGLEVAEKLFARRPDIKVLFMSGYADNAMIQKATSARNANFLQKPFAPAALVAKVREILDA